MIILLNLIYIRRFLKLVRFTTASAILEMVRAGDNNFPLHQLRQFANVNLNQYEIDIFFPPGENNINGVDAYTAILRILICKGVDLDPNILYDLLGNNVFANFRNPNLNNSEFCALAAATYNLPILIRLCAAGFVWDAETTVAAVEYPEILVYALQNGCPWNPLVYGIAADNHRSHPNNQVFQNCVAIALQYGCDQPYNAPN